MLCSWVNVIKLHTNTCPLQKPSINRRMDCSHLARRLVAGVFVFCSSLGFGQTTDIVITNDLVLPKGATLNARLVVRVSSVTIDGNGASLVGPGTIGDTNSLAEAGIGVL